MNAASDRKVVISGVGCILPGASTPGEFWERLVAGQSAIAPYRDAQIHSKRIAYFGGIDAQQRAAALEALPFKLRRYSTACSQWGAKAAADALAAAGLDLKTVPDTRRGLFTAQGDYSYPSLQSFTDGIAAAHAKNALDIPALTHEFMHLRGADPFFVIKCLANNLLSITSLAFEMRGDCGAFVHDDSAVIAALRSAVFSLRHGYCDVALLVCAGSYNEAMTLAEMARMDCLSAGTAGAASLRPFDARGDGTILGEGAIALVLETASHARRRGALPLATVSGIGSLVEMGHEEGKFDAYARCVQQALEQSELEPADIGAIVATGKGSLADDRREAQLLAALPPHCARLPVTCPTPITGTIPSCPLRLLSAIGMLQHGWIPPIANLQQPLDTRLQLVRGAAVAAPLRHVLALTAGRTGSHSAIVLSQPFD